VFRWIFPKGLKALSILVARPGCTAIILSGIGTPKSNGQLSAFRPEQGGISKNGAVQTDFFDRMGSFEMILVKKENLAEQNSEKAQEHLKNPV
jgi:hypothetical protein